MENVGIASETLVKTHIYPDTLDVKPTIRIVGINEENKTPFGELSKHIEQLAGEIYPILSTHGLITASGKGWERVEKDPDFGVMKLGFGEDTTKISQADLTESKVENNIVFTAKEMCEVASYSVSKTIKENFPALEMEWMTFQTNMMENQKGPLVPHHILIIGTEKADYKLFLDMTYGQVINGEGVLLAPLKSLARWYPELIDQKTIPLEQAWDQYETRLKDDNNLRQITDALLKDKTKQ